MTTPLTGTASRVGVVTNERTAEQRRAELGDLAVTTLTTIDGAADKYELFEAGVNTTQRLASHLAKSGRLGPAVLGAAASGLVEKVAPGAVRKLAGVVSERMGELGQGMERFASTTAGKTVSRGLAVAGVAAIAYDAVSTFSNTDSDTGSKALMAGAAVAGNALFFAPGGTALLAVEVATGGGVTGSVKGLAALWDAKVNGDPRALTQWKSEAKEGEMGWAIKWAATGEPPGIVKNAGATISRAWNWVTG